jgi:hypothetical protein
LALLGGGFVKFFGKRKSTVPTPATATASAEPPPHA